jgi:6-phosphofructokinase
VLSGGQAPGGHNVISGIYDMAKKLHPDSKVYGFLAGPHGVYTGNYVEIKEDFLDLYRNMGGFDMIRSGRHKIETPEQF